MKNWRNILNLWFGLGRKFVLQFWMLYGISMKIFYKQVPYSLSKNVFFSSLSGKSRIYIFSNFYLRVCHEDHSLRFCITSYSVFTECLEFAWFHHCHDWVRIFPPSHYIVFFVKSFFTEKFTKNSLYFQCCEHNTVLSTNWGIRCKSIEGISCIETSTSCLRCSK